MDMKTTKKTCLERRGMPRLTQTMTMVAYNSRDNDYPEERVEEVNLASTSRVSGCTWVISKEAVGNS